MRSRHGESDGTRVTTESFLDDNSKCSDFLDGNMERAPVGNIPNPVLVELLDEKGMLTELEEKLIRGALEKMMLRYDSGIAYKAESATCGLNCSGMIFFHSCVVML